MIWRFFVPHRGSGLSNIAKIHHLDQSLTIPETLRECLLQNLMYVTPLAYLRYFGCDSKSRYRYNARERKFLAFVGELDFYDKF